MPGKGPILIHYGLQIAADNASIEDIASSLPVAAPIENSEPSSASLVMDSNVCATPMVPVVHWKYHDSCCLRVRFTVKKKVDRVPLLPQTKQRSRVPCPGQVGSWRHA